jgi:hypothetical protein
MWIGVKFHNFRTWPNWTGHDRGESYVCVHVVSWVTVWDSVCVCHRQALLRHVANWMHSRRGEFWPMYVEGTGSLWKRQSDRLGSQSVPALYLFTHSPIDIWRGIALCCVRGNELIVNMYCRIFGAIVKVRKATVSFVRPITVSAWNSAATWRMFMNFSIFRQCDVKIQV